MNEYTTQEELMVALTHLKNVLASFQDLPDALIQKIYTFLNLLFEEAVKKEILNLN